LTPRRAKTEPRAPELPRKETPRLPELPGASTSADRVCWRFTHVDHDGPWGFASLGADGWLALLGQLAQFETMTITELFHKGDYPGKSYDPATLPDPRAARRLEAMRLTDMTRISALRTQGRPRLWGFLVGNVFHVVWWDPEHEVWPSTLKHT
jgi:hypothetical protein